MKKYILITLTLCFSFGLVSCDDWLNAPTPGTTKLEDFFTSGNTAIQVVNAAYVPLMWEYNETFYPEWFIGDVVSDDALKGGQYLGDMPAVYDMENFKTTSDNELLLDYYRAQYQGVSRCNLALQEIPKVDTDTLMDARLKDRLIGEVEFLRAMYYFRLVRVFGGVPKVDFVVDSSEKWGVQRATAEEIYDFIIEDLENAQKRLWRKQNYPLADLGRATKGAAQAMLLKVNLYMHRYNEAKSCGDSIISSGDYELVNRYFDNFTLEGENGPESVFEIQYMIEGTSDYSEGNGATRGTFTTKLVRGRNKIFNTVGWGFNRPTQNLYDEYEAGDPRRDETIINLTDDEITNPSEEIYLGSRYLNRKYAWTDEFGTYPKLDHDSRGPLNNKVIRYADVLLMYAEACCESNNLDRAKWALDQVRARACGNDRNILPVFPDYECNLWDEGAAKYVKRRCNDTQQDLLGAIRHERRVELGMEGHRWFDLCRWGIAKEVLDAYNAQEVEEVQASLAPFVKGKHELFPIPRKEIDLNGIEQNPGY